MPSSLNTEWCKTADKSAAIGATLRLLQLICNIQEEWTKFHIICIEKHEYFCQQFLATPFKPKQNNIEIWCKAILLWSIPNCHVALLEIAIFIISKIYLTKKQPLGRTQAKKLVQGRKAFAYSKSSFPSTQHTYLLHFWCQRSEKLEINMDWDRKKGCEPYEQALDGVKWEIGIHKPSCSIMRRGYYAKKYMYTLELVAHSMLCNIIPSDCSHSVDF